jgi:hypothetical protein
MPTSLGERPGLERWAVLGHSFGGGEFEPKPIPDRHTCTSKDLSPPLSWPNVPEGTGSLVPVDDPDAPGVSSRTGSLGRSIRAQERWRRASRRRARGETTSAGAATADPVHLRATGATATSSACTRSTPSPIWRPALRRRAGAGDRGACADDGRARWPTSAERACHRRRRSRSRAPDERVADHGRADPSARNWRASCAGRRVRPAGARRA